jgi:phage gp46-like protein
MELFLKNGDYLPDGQGGFCRVTGREELLQRVLWKLSVRRGGFPFLPQLGSRLYTLVRQKPAQWAGLAEEYVVEALADETDLRIDGVEVAQDGENLSVTVRLNWQGEDLSVKLAVEE